MHLHEWVHHSKITSLSLSRMLVRTVCPSAIISEFAHHFRVQKHAFVCCLASREKPALVNWVVVFALLWRFIAAGEVTTTLLFFVCVASCRAWNCRTSRNLINHGWLTNLNCRCCIDWRTSLLVQLRCHSFLLRRSRLAACARTGLSCLWLRQQKIFRVHWAKFL